MQRCSTNTQEKNKCGAHRRREWTHRMEFVVESAGVADGFALCVTAPQCRRHRAAVGAGQTGSTATSTARLFITYDDICQIENKRGI